MAVYQVTGPDGNLYRIEGPEGATDAEVIAAVRSQIEAETASAPTAPMSIEDQVARDIELQQLLRRSNAGFFENVLSGLGTGAIAPLESAALGTAALLDEEQELEAREAIQSAADYVSPSGGDPEALSYKLASGVGSLGAFLGTALLGAAALPAAGALAIGAGAGEASERARAAGISEEDRGSATLKGAFVGATEILPLGRFVSKLGIPVLTDMVNKLGPKTVEKFRDRIVNAAWSGGIEGAQEATAAVLQNAIEQGYNPDQTLIEGAAEEGGIGAFAGALLGLFLPGKTKDVAVDDAKDQADEILALPAPEERLGLPAPEETLGLPAPQGKLPAPRMIATEEGQVIPESEYDALRRVQEAEQESTLADVLPPEALRGIERNAEALRAERVRQEQEAKAAEDQRQGQLAQGLEAVQRVAREEAQMGDLDVTGIERELSRRRSEAEAKAAVAPAQEKLALAAAERGDEAEFAQPDLFPVELLRDREQYQGPTAPDAVDAMPAARASAELRSRQFDLVTRAEDETELARMIAEDEAMRMESEIESLTGRQVSAQERATAQRRRNILLGVIESTPSQNYNKVIRAYKEALSADGVQKTDPTPEETATIQRAVNTQRAFVEEQQIPTTPEASQLSEMESLIPERGRKTAQQPKKATPEVAPEVTPEVTPEVSKAAQPAAQPAPKAERRPVTATDLKNLGIPKISGAYNVVLGKDLNDPAQRQEVSVALDNYAKTSRIKAKTKQKIQDFITKAEQDVQPVKTKPAAGRKGDEPSVPSTPTRSAPVVGRGAERPAGTGRTGLGARKSDTASTPVRAKSKPAPLKAKPSEKELPPYDKTLGRPLDMTVLDVKLPQSDTKKISALPDPKAELRKTLTPEIAAGMYFRRYKRPADALEAMAFDVANNETGYTKTGNNAIDLHFEGTSAKSALKAKGWIEENLTPSTKNLLDLKIREQAAKKKLADKAYQKLQKEQKQRQQALLATALRKETSTTKTTKEVIKTLDEFTTSSLEISGLSTTLEAAESVSEMSATERNKLRESISSDVQAYLDAGGNVEQLLTEDSVIDLTAQVHPAVSKMLRGGDLQGALYALGKTGASRRIRKVAAKLADKIGTTKVVVEKNLKDSAGNTVAGLFDPKTNTIKLNSDYAGSAHTLLHEATHAVTSATLANKSHPLTKQLQKLYEEVKEALPDEYGSKSLDEFVAEAFTNPEFRQQLGGMRIGNEKVTALQKFLTSVGNFLRRLLGLQPVEAENMLTKVDGLVEAIMAPSVASRDAGKLYMASATGTGGKVVDDAQKNPPKITKETVDSFLELLKSAVPQKVKDAALSLLPIDQLSDMAIKYVPAAKKFNDLIQEEVGRLNEVRNKIEAPVKSIAKWVSSSSKDVQKAFNDLVHLSTLYQVDPEKPRSDYEGKTDASGNDKAESWDIVNKLWVKVGEDGHTQYRTARNIYRYTFSLLKDSISARLDAAGVDPKTKKRAMDEILAKMTKSAIEPYFALTRSGDFRVSYNAVDPNTKNFETYVSFFESDFARTRFLQQLRQELYKENKSAIDKLAREKKMSVQDAINSFHSVSKFNKIEDGTFANAPQASFIGTIIKTLEANNVSPEAKADIIELMLNSMPERSIARALQSRNEGGVLGFENDAVKALKSKSFSLSNQLVRMEYSSKLSKVETEIREQLKKSRNSADPELTTYLGNEVLRRIPFARRPDLPNWARNLRLFGFTMTLGLNVSSATVNLFQLPMVVMPYVAPMYGGFKTVSGSIGKATRLFANSGTNRKLNVVSDKLVNGEVVFETKTVEGGVAGRSLDNYFEVNSDGSLRVRNDMGLTDAQKREVQELAELVEVAGDMAQLNRSITYDLLEMDKTSSLTDKMATVSGFVFHHSERLNRQVTLTTIYDLEIKKRKKAKGKLSRQDRIEAAREAVRITDLTNGGTAAAGTARIAQTGLGSVVFLFKRYGISMYYLLTKTLNDALRGASPEAKKLARQQFAGIFGTTALLAGARGLPFFGALAMIYNLFADDDEERFEEVVAKHFGEPINGGMLNYLTGLDIGSRVALSDLIFRAPRIEKDQSAIWTIAESLGGPALGSAMAMEYGIRLLGQGEIQRGVEQVSPAAIRNMLKTARYIDEDGVLTRRKDPVIEDLNGFNLGAQFFGFAPAEYTQKMAINATQKRKDRKITTDKTSLLRKYYIALRQGDSKEANKIIRDIIEFNSKNPLVAITPDTIKRSMSQHMRTTQRMYNGVLFSPKLIDSLIQDASEYDSDISIWQ